MYLLGQTCTQDEVASVVFLVLPPSISCLTYDQKYCAKNTCNMKNSLTYYIYIYVDTFTCTVNYNYTYKYLLVSRCVSADIQSNFSCILEKKKVYAGCSGSMSWKEYFMSAWKTTSCAYAVYMALTCRLDLTYSELQGLRAPLPLIRPSKYMI